MERNTLTLLDEKDQLKKRATELISGAENEVRKLNDVENTEFEAITKQLDEIDQEIRKIEEDNKRNLNKVTTTKQTNQTMENFSLLKAINDLANNKQLDERAQEVNNAGQAEFRKAGQNYSGQLILPMETRTIQATVATSGQEVVSEDILNILEPLRANLVMVQAGATYIGGLTGNVAIPSYSGSNVT
jgi:HK97 family phage major capsid protein